MAQNITLRAQVAALTELVEKLVASGAPVVAAAKSPVGPTKFADTEFGAKQLARAAAKLPCELGHGDSCNRRFSENSKGRTQHEPRIV